MTLTDAELAALLDRAIDLAVADVAELVFAGPRELVPPLPGPHRPHLPAMQEALRAARPDFVRHAPHPRATEPFERYVERRGPTAAGMTPSDEPA